MLLQLTNASSKRLDALADSAGGLQGVNQGTLTDRSGSITSGGTAQQLAAASTSRRWFYFQNHSDTDMWINFGTTAVADQPSIKVPLGTSFTMDRFVSTELISVICATTGKKFTAKEST